MINFVRKTCMILLHSIVELSLIFIIIILIVVAMSIITNLLGLL